MKLLHPLGFRDGGFFVMQKFDEKFGVIDIGSNTIRGVVYNRAGEIEENTAYESHILSDNVGGVLSEEGIARLCGTLKSLLDIFARAGCKKSFAFATSAMRDVQNFDRVYEYVLSETNVKIDLLSGEEEAECDFLAFAELSGGKEAIGIDLGGGSAQLVAFSREGVREAVSLPIGTKRMKSMFCAGTVPTAEEIKKTEEYITGQLLCIKSRSDEVIFTGGTARTALSAAKKLLNAPKLCRKGLSLMFDLTAENPALLKSAFEKRYETMPMGLVIMNSLCRAIGAEKITVTDTGVREGYILKLGL